jgi:hypothetical protein
LIRTILSITKQPSEETPRFGLDWRLRQVVNIIGRAFLAASIQPVIVNIAYCALGRILIENSQAVFVRVVLLKTTIAGASDLERVARLAQAADLGAASDFAERTVGVCAAFAGVALSVELEDVLIAKGASSIDCLETVFNWDLDALVVRKREPEFAGATETLAFVSDAVVDLSLGHLALAH